MSGKKIVALALLAAGGALGVLGARAETERRAGEDLANEAASTATQAQSRLNAERHRLESRVVAAAQIKQLQAALENKVDGPTLVDLFQSEDWWRELRGEFPMARVILGFDVLATYGAPDPGTQDKAVVTNARKNPVASAVVDINDRPYFLLASRVGAVADKAPVLVLAKAVDAGLQIPVAAPLVGPSPRQPTDLGMIAGAVVFILGGGILLVASRGGPGKAQVAIPGQTARENTLRFGTTAQKRAVDIAGPRAVAVPTRLPAKGEGSAAVAPAPVAVPSTPAPVGPPRHATVPGGVPVTETGKPGKTFGRYQLLDRLGEGGMAEVYTAVAYGAEGFSRTFVVKRLRPELARDKDAVAQFIDEARMQASLVHSNIVPVFDFGGSATSTSWPRSTSSAAIWCA